jgi:hypothetical protein
MCYTRGSCLSAYSVDKQVLSTFFVSNNNFVAKGNVRKMRFKIFLYGSLLIAMTTVGCSFEFSHESAGGMLVVEDSLDGKAKCVLYARNRTIDEVLKLIKPKLRKTLTIDQSVDVDRKVGEIDIKAADWPSVLDELATALELRIEENDDMLSLASGG